MLLDRARKNCKLGGKLWQMGSVGRPGLGRKYPIKSDLDNKRAEQLTQIYVVNIVKKYTHTFLLPFDYPIEK
jgi:hypothetical protein